MNYYFVGRIPPSVCDVATNEFEAIAPYDAQMNPEDNLVTDHQRRSTTLRAAEPWNWFSGILYQCGLEGNSKEGWNYLVDTQEQVQFATYEEGQHYNWHIDTFLLSGRPLDRKVTVVCLMNDPSEFEGGELQFNVHGQYFTAELKKGSYIAFPSFILHRVTPVTKGVRKTATLWLSGPAFK